MLPQVFGRFLLGLYVGKREYIYHVAEYTPLLRRALPWLLLIACAGNGASVAREWAQHTLRLPPATTWMVALRPLMEAGVVCLSACYAVWIALLLQSRSWAPVVARLAPVGRMALTNYLAHSLFYLFFLTGAGLGTLGHFGATVCLALSILIFGAQVIFSSWWLRHYRPSINRTRLTAVQWQVPRPSLCALESKGQSGRTASSKGKGLPREVRTRRADSLRMLNHIKNFHDIRLGRKHQSIQRILH
jgi:hypothetical protein